MENNKICVLNWSGFLIVVATAVCTSLLLSVERSSSSGEDISWLEIVRAVLSGAVAALGFFTRRKVEQTEETEEK